MKGGNCSLFQDYIIKQKRKEMQKVILPTILAVCIIGFSGCSSKSSKLVLPPKGGASIKVMEPVWITGTKRPDASYSLASPEAKETDYLQVINAGYWLANTHGKISQLVYAFDLSIKKPFPQDIVYTRAIFTNPENIDKPIVYEHFLDNKYKSTKVTHATLSNVEMGKTYHMIFEVYSDKNRTQLLTKIDQPIVSLVDNISGCVKLDNAFMIAIYGKMLDPSGQTIPVDKLIIACEK